MTNGKNDRTVFKREDGKWVNKKDDAGRASSVHDTQRELFKPCVKTSCIKVEPISPHMDAMGIMFYRRLPHLLAFAILT